MRIITFLSTMTLILFFSSCQYKQGTKCTSDKTDTILIVYLTGDIETISRIDCETMANKNYYKNIIADTIRIPQNDFSTIRYSLRNLKYLIEKNSCNSRIYIKMDSISVCIGTHNCACTFNKSIINLNLKTIYLIKCKSGYYNYFSKEQLLYDESIIKYGIPKDYKYQRSAPSIKRKEIVKIIMIEKHNR